MSHRTAIRQTLYRSPAAIEADEICGRLSRLSTRGRVFDWFPLKNPIQTNDGSLKLGTFSSAKGVVVLSVTPGGVLLASGRRTTIHTLIADASVMAPAK